MKKYFVVETDEGCEFGDALHLVMFKELEDGKVTIEKDVEFTEDSKDWFIEMNFIEEREVGEEENNSPENDLLDFGDETPCEELEALIEDYENLEERVDKLEEKAEKFIDMHKDFVKLTTDMLDTFREFTLGFPEKKATAQPKKK